MVYVIYREKKGYNYGSNAYVNSWKQYNVYKETGASKAVKIYHNGHLITQGFMLVDFVFPWQNYREIIVYNEIEFTNEEYINQYPTYTYYSLDDQYKIEIYELKEEPEVE